MADAYEEVEPNRIKHLEFIQAVVARLAGNSFLIKGWAVTVASAFLGLAVSRGESRLAWPGLAPVLFFWGLDAYFLYAERLFRALYEQVRKSDPNVQPFYMAATSDTFVDALEGAGVKGIRFMDAVRRPTVSAFHGALLIAVVLVALALR